MTNHVVVDVDPGIDDSYALAVLIGAQKLGILRIAAIVCSAGNTSRRKACFNLVRILITLNAYDVPIFEGTCHPIVRSQLYSRHYGTDGFANIYETPSNPLKLNTTEEFCHFVQTKFRPRKLTMLCFGPLTLTAAFILQNSERFFKAIWIMGGNHPGQPLAYWTFQRDPEAVDVVLRRIRAPITLVPWKLTHDLGIPMAWRAKTLASLNLPFITMMNLVEHKNMRSKKEWIMPNAVMAVAYVFPEMVLNSTEEYVIINREFPTSERTGLLMCSAKSSGGRKVRIITQLNCEVYKKRLLETVNQTCPSISKPDNPEMNEETESPDPSDEYGWCSL